MSKCLDKAVGDMLYEYELGLLSEEETDLLEAHLLACSHCRELMLEHQEVSELVREDSEVRELIAELGREPSDAASADSESTVRTPLNRLRSAWRPLAVAAGLVALLILRPWNLQFQPGQDAVASDRLLMVTPFGNLVDPTDSNGLAMIASDLIAAALSESRFLRVVSSQTVADLSDALTSAETDVGDSVAVPLRVARAARAAYMLSGSIVQVDPSLVLTTRVVDVASGEVVLSHRVRTDSTGSVFDLVDQLASRIANDLLVPLGFDEQYNPAVADVTTRSAQAYRYYLEGREFLRKQYIDDAQRSFERALEFDSTFAMCYYHLAWYFDADMIVQAVRYSKQASHRERQHILALDAIIKRDLAGAESILRGLLDDYPEDVRCWTMLANVAQRQNRIPEAIALLEQALRFNPVHRRAINVLSYLHQQMGDTERAIATVDAYITMAPGEPNPYDTKADILSQSGRLDEAIANYQIVRSIKPDFGDYSTALELGQLHKYRGDYDLARDCFQDGATYGGSDGRSSARTNLALLPLYRGQLAEGRRVLADGMGADRLDKACARGHGPGQKNHFVAGMVHLAIGEFDQAAERLAIVIEIGQTVNPDDSMSYRTLYAFALASAGRNAAADSVLEQLDRHRDDDEVSADVYRVGRAFVSYARGDYATAVEEFNRISMKAIREGFSIQFWLGRAYLESGVPSQAVGEFSAILDDYADPYRSLMAIWDAQTHYYLACSYEASGQPVAAIEQYEVFVDLWKTADPALRPMVDEADRRLTLLKQGIQ